MGNKSLICSDLMLLEAFKSNWLQCNIYWYHNNTATQFLYLEFRQAAIVEISQRVLSLIVGVIVQSNPSATEYFHELALAAIYNNIQLVAI